MLTDCQIGLSDDCTLVLESGFDCVQRIYIPEYDQLITVSEVEVEIKLWHEENYQFFLFRNTGSTDKASRTVPGKNGTA